MKKIILAAIAIFLITGLACAQDNNFTLKQGLLYTWNEKEVKGLTTITVANTTPIPALGRWNALLDGWTLDAGWAYSSGSLDSAALIIGREFGTLGKYLPINFPLMDKIKITLYPVGVYVRDVFDHPKVQGCTGGGIIKLTLNF